MLAHLGPEGHELRAAGVDILAAQPVVVLVEDHGEVLRQGLVHQAVERREPAGGQFLLLVHEVERAEHDAHRGEAAILDELEVPRLEARLGGVEPQRVVADDVHAALHLRHLLGGGKRCVMAGSDCAGVREYET